MASGKSSKPEVLTYGDYEMITPDTTKLRKLLRPEMPGEDDPVARAEQALAAISGDFTDWMQDECTRLDNARLKVRDNGLSKQTRQELFLAAHDIKGDSGTLGYPEVGPAAESLCRLLEHTPDLKRIPLAIVDQHGRAQGHPEPDDRAKRHVLRTRTHKQSRLGQPIRRNGRARTRLIFAAAMRKAADR
jgi:chemotaxis protein histidine kinase CheA